MDSFSPNTPGLTGLLDDSPTVMIRLSEIVAFGAPDARLVDKHLAELRAGKSIALLEIDSEWLEHWDDKKGAPEYLGMGYALIEGHDRHSALVAHLGAHTECEVLMQGLRPIKAWRASMT